MTYFSYERELLGQIEGLRAQLLARPLNLGGVAGSGGGGGGGTGYIGYLPQTRVAYDASELATMATAVSGSLIDNLNHIRYRLGVIESGGVGGSIAIYESGVLVDSNVTTIDFLGATVEQVSPGSITVTTGSNDAVRMAIFTAPSGLSIGSNKIRIYNVTGSSKTISRVFLSADTAPTGSSIIVDVNKNGSTIFTTQSNRPQIADGQNTGSTTTIDVPSWAEDEYITIDIDQVGSSTAGSDLTVHVVYS